MYETIGDRIEVLTRFGQQGVRPLEFRWKGTAVPIREVTSTWHRSEGTERKYYFSVVGETGDYYELCFDVRNLRWSLERVCLEG